MAHNTPSVFQTPRQTLFLWIYRIVLIGIFFAGGILRFSLPSEPFMDLDTGEYLSPAIHFSSDGSYIPTWRSFPYPLFLALTLRLIPHLSAITWIQHTVGLFTAAIIVLVLLRSRIFLPKGALLDWSARVIALIAAYVFLFSYSSIELEHTIRPEVFFSLFSALTILAGMEFSQRIFLNQKLDGLGAAWGIVLIFLAVSTYYVKPAWGFAVGTSLLPLVGACFWISGRWKWKIKTVGIGAFLAIFLLVLPSRFLETEFLGDKSPFFVATLLCTHAEFFRETMEKDALALPPDSKLKTHILEFTKAIRAAQHHPSYKRYGLSLNPDDLMYQGPLSRLYLGVTESGLSFSNFGYHYYISAWQRHPILLFQKIARQIEYFYTPTDFHIYDIHTALPIKLIFGSLDESRAKPKIVSSLRTAIRQNWVIFSFKS